MLEIKSLNTIKRIIYKRPKENLLTIHWLKLEPIRIVHLHMLSSINTLSFLVKTPIRQFTCTNVSTFRIVSSRYFATGVIDSIPEMNKNEGNSNNQEKKEGRWSGKNAWKLGALSLGATMAFAVGFGVAQWGMTEQILSYT